MRFERQSVIQDLPKIVRSGPCSVITEDARRCQNKAAYIVCAFDSHANRDLVIRVCKEHATTFERIEAIRIKRREKLVADDKESMRVFVEQMREQCERERKM